MGAPISKRTSSRQSGGRRTRSSIGNDNVIPEEETSMRVMYEDPGLAEERKKLMNLLKGQSQGSEQESPSKTTQAPEGSRRSKRTKKSTRIS